MISRVLQSKCGSRVLSTGLFIPYDANRKVSIVSQKCLLKNIVKDASFEASALKKLHEDAKLKSIKNSILVEDDAIEAPIWDVSFSNVEDAYKSKSNTELMRSLLVFKICGINSIVDNSMLLTRLSAKVLGQTLFKKFMKMSFYGHFVAGEDHNEIKVVTSKLQKYGVGAILDYAVEEDVSEEKAVKLELESCTPHDNPEHIDMKQKDKEKRYQAHHEFADRRKKVVSARTYFYEGEAQCDENLNIFLKCIDAASETAEDGFAAVKLTALGRPQFLLQFSEVLMKARELFVQFTGKDQTGPLVDRNFDLKRFENKSSKMGMEMSKEDALRWFTWMDKDDSGVVDLLDWDELVGERQLSDIFCVFNPDTGEMERLIPGFNAEEEAQMKRMLRRIDTLAKHAAERNVRLMVDAEQTYFQPAISRMCMEMQKKFNKEKAIIINTYQCYLKDTRDNLLIDLVLSRREKFHFGLKLVRGAYMEQERDRARELNYEDPIQPDYESTNANYHTNLRTILEEIKRTGNVDVMVATHNENTVQFTLQKMEELDLHPMSKNVYFGQLYGMCDHITFPLGQAGHNVFKYLPFGPVNEVLPYLHRRAQENRAVLGSGSLVERRLLWEEVKRRVGLRH